jgi:hypothetical protein
MDILKKNNVILRPGKMGVRKPRGFWGTSGWQEYRHSKGMAARVTGRSLG